MKHRITVIGVVLLVCLTLGAVFRGIARRQDESLDRYAAKLQEPPKDAREEWMKLSDRVQIPTRSFYPNGYIDTGINGFASGYYTEKLDAGFVSLDDENTPGHLIGLYYVRNKYTGETTSKKLVGKPSDMKVWLAEWRDLGVKVLN